MMRAVACSVRSISAAVTPVMPLPIIRYVSFSVITMDSRSIYIIFFQGILSLLDVRQLLYCNCDCCSFFTFNSESTNIVECGVRGLVQIHFEIHASFLCITCIKILDLICLIGEGDSVTLFYSNSCGIAAIHIARRAFLLLDGYCCCGTT